MAIRCGARSAHILSVAFHNRQAPVTRRDFAPHIQGLFTRHCSRSDGMRHCRAADHPSTIRRYYGVSDQYFRCRDGVGRSRATAAALATRARDRIDRSRSAQPGHSRLSRWASPRRSDEPSHPQHIGNHVDALARRGKSLDRPYRHRLGSNRRRDRSPDALTAAVRQRVPGLAGVVG